jgi:hypothetical protein
VSALATYVYDNAEHGIENGVAPTHRRKGQSFADSDLEPDFENLPTDECLGCGVEVQFTLIKGQRVSFEKGNRTRLSLTVPHICVDPN